MQDSQKVKVSIIIPVYNAEEFLEECIRSVQKQTMCEWEILCTDDGSSDASHSILEKQRQEDERIHIFTQANQGAGAARNLALKHAAGEFVCFLDADDGFLDPGALDALYDSAVRQKVSVCGGQFYMNVCGDRKYVNIYGSLYQGNQKETLVRYSDYQYDYHYQNYLYKRSMLAENQIVFPHYMRVEDTHFFVRAMAAAEIFCIVDVPFYSYWVSDKTVSYREHEMAEYLQGMIENLEFSAQRGLKKLHRLIYYRMLELCRRIWKQYVSEKNMVLCRKLGAANAVIRWEWLEEACRIKERMLEPLAEIKNLSKKESGILDAESPEKWKLPVSYLKKGSRIALYGAGDVGGSYYRQLRNSGEFILCAWADQNYDKIETGYPLVSPEELRNTVFDSVIIGAAEIVPAMEIMDKLLSFGIPAEKIVWDIGR